MKVFVAAFVFGVLLICTDPCSAQDMPKYETYRDRFEEVRAAFGDRYPAIVLEDRADVEMASRGRLQMVHAEYAFVVLDPEKAREVIDLVFPIPPGSKFKYLRAWSWRPGDAEPLLSKPDDVHIQKTIGAWKEARISIPGVVPGSLCGIQFHYDRGGLSGGRTFRWSFPVVQASYTLKIPWIGSEKSFQQFEEYFTFEVRGEAEQLGGLSARGFVRTWKFRDVPANPGEPLALAKDRPATGVILRPRDAKWSDYVSGVTNGLDVTPAPAGLLADLKSRVGEKPPDVVIRTVAEYFDDPANFRLTSDVRHPYASASPEKVAKKKEGTALDKAVLAHLLLRELGVENSLVLGASIYGVDLDWDTATPGDLDASLLFFPDQPMGQDLWDVADTSTPFGLPGPDLNPSMLILVKGDKSPIMLCKILAGKVKESRKTTIEFNETGTAEGKVSWTFSAWPSFRGLDPFDPTVKMDDPLKGITGIRANLLSPGWTAPAEHHFRCSDTKPSVLDAQISMEATPRGESGWELKPLVWSAPDHLPAKMDPERRTRAFLDREISIADTVIIRARVPAREVLPAPLHIGNPLGNLNCSWEVAGDSIVISRKLFVRAGEIPPQNVKYYNEILAGWQKTMGQGVAVEGVGP